jgi:hypothetical protein
MSLEDVLAARNAFELYQSKQQDKPPSPSNNPLDSISNHSKTADAKTPPDTEEEPPLKAKRDLVDLPETIDENTEPPSSSVSSVGHEEVPIIKDQGSLQCLNCKSFLLTRKKKTSMLFNIDESEAEPVAAKPRGKKRQINNRQEENNNNNMNNNNKKGGAKRRYAIGASRRGKPRSRTSTPQPRDVSPPAGDSSSTSNTIATSIFDYFTPQARASSPPARVKYPKENMSLTDMNKRTEIMLEHISGMQVDMATKEQHGHLIAGNDDVNVRAKRALPSPITIPENTGDDASSLSSASTIPLEEPMEHEPGVAEEAIEKSKEDEDQTSLELMDTLTGELIKFQRKFSPRNTNDENENALAGESEGRVTRNREASSLYRNMKAH